jgi:predicted dehydrogenase
LQASPAFYGSEGCILGDQLISDSGTSVSLLQVFDEQISEEERERFFPLGLTDPYAIQQLDWLRAIEQAKDPETSGAEGLMDLACAFAMLESSAAHRQVAVAEVLSGDVSAYQDEINAYYGL